jgi:hypothetical protein
MVRAVVSASAAESPSQAKSIPATNCSSKAVSTPSGRFEGDLIVRNRLLIKATGRVSGTIRYGQIEIECGGQIFGDIQAQPAGELGKPPLPGGFPAFVPDDRSGIH